MMAPSHTGGSGSRSRIAPQGDEQLFTRYIDRLNEARFIGPIGELAGSWEYDRDDARSHARVDDGSVRTEALRSEPTQEFYRSFPDLGPRPAIAEHGKGDVRLKDHDGIISQFDTELPGPAWRERQDKIRHPVRVQRTVIGKPQGGIGLPIVIARPVAVRPAVCIQ